MSKPGREVASLTRLATEFGRHEPPSHPLATTKLQFSKLRREQFLGLEQLDIDNAWVSARRAIPNNDSRRETMLHGKRESKEWSSGRLLAVKDNLCTIREPTTCASGMLLGFRSPFAAAVVEKAEAAGFEVVGKTNLDEFGMGSNSTNSIFGPVQNWYRRQGELTSAGGSSGGSAVAVTMDQCHEALGTDTGGSVRLPAAYTGVVGFKPSYGRVSRRGVVAYANSLDTVGILARTSVNVGKIFGIIEGHDARDPTSIKYATRSRINALTARHRSRDQTLRIRHPSERLLRIGVPSQYNTQELQPIVRQAWIDTLKSLQSRGHSIHPISLPTTSLALSAYYIIAPAEASSNLAKYDGMRYGSLVKGNESERKNGVLYSGIRGAGLGNEVKRRILLGSYSLSATAIDNYFIKAQKIRRLVQQDFNRVFSLHNPLLNEDQQDHSDGHKKVDVIITPTAQSVAPKLKDLLALDAIDAYSTDVLTVPSSLAGLPAISVPVTVPNMREDLGPIGMQVLGQYGDDRRVIAAAMAIESLSQGKYRFNLRGTE